MRHALILVLVLNSLNIFAKTYYFSSTEGDDSRSSTAAQNSSTPWKSISKLNSIWSSLQPGDQVLFKRGDTFYGTIIPSKSGSSSASILIGAYGSGSKPAITTYRTLSSWTANSSYPGVYQSESISSDGNLVFLVSINGTPQAMGRYPNITAKEKGYLTVDSHISNTSIYDAQLSSSPNWTGAEVVIKTCRWMIDRNKITSHSGGTLKYISATGSPGRDGFGYFIQNSIKTLDVFGEWYFDPSSKRLNLFFGAQKPSGFTIQVATKDNLVFTSNQSYLTFDNLNFQGCNDQGLDINGGTGNIIQNCDVQSIGTDGVNASGTGLLMNNCSVVNCFNNGISVAKGTNAKVTNNLVRKTYYMPGMGGSGNGQGAGIRNCPGGLVEYNNVFASGYIGIQMGGDNSTLKNNLIDSFSFIKDDGGGIYTSNGYNTGWQNRKIIGNILLNGIGAPDGSASPNSSAQGIYLDDNANHVEISGNTVVNCNMGTLLHNSRDVIVSGNTFYDNENGQIYMKHDGLGDPLRNHTVSNNIFFSKHYHQIVSAITSSENDIQKTGVFDYNYYARPIDDESTIYSAYKNSSGQTVKGRYDLKTWKSLYNLDKTSQKSSKTISPFTVISPIGVNKFSYGNFSTSLDIKKLWPNLCSLFWANSGELDGGCLKISPSALGSSIVMNIGPVSSQKKYLIKFSVRGTGSTSLSGYLRASDYKPLTEKKYWSIDTTRKECEFLMIPTASNDNASLLLTLDLQQTYYIDNISCIEVSAQVTNPDDSLTFVYNASKASKTISLKGNFVDVKNTKYSGSITLKPYTSAVLIADGGNVTTTTNKAPVVSITSPKANASYGNDPSDIRLTADASDSDGSISKLEFYSGKTLIQTENSAPYDWTWPKVATGNYTITAKAYDNKGAVTESSPVSFTVGSPVSVAITSPKSGSTYNSSSDVQLTASTSGTISKVEFYNGSKLLTTENLAPWNWTWRSVASGNYTITAKAYDNDGNVTTSIPVSIQVGLPTVSITSPKVNETFDGPANIRITVDANDPDGSISKVELYNGSTLLTTEKYYPYAWTWTGVTNGTYIITAKAFDNQGNSVTSSKVTVTVVSAGAPQVAITSPSTNDNFASPASVRVTASASDTDGSIAKVEFYSGNTIIKTEYTAPYDFTWSNVTSGTYQITAKAYDNLGYSNVSAPVTFSVGATSIANTSISAGTDLPANSTSQSLPVEVTQFKLYPNPARDYMNVIVSSEFAVGEKISLTILNISGATVMQSTISASNSNRIDIAKLAPGAYVLKLSSQTKTVAKNFIKTQ